MISAIAVIIFLISLVIGRLLFNRLFNHISLYSLVWFIIIFLFDQKLIRYYPISTSTWLIILLAFFSFLLGVLSTYTALNINNEKKILLANNEEYFDSCWFRDDAKLLMKLVVVLGIIGILVSVQNWYVLLKKFGNVQSVLLNASLLYKMRVQRTIEGQIPYLFTLSYVAVFFLLQSIRLLKIKLH